VSATSAFNEELRSPVLTFKEGPVHKKRFSSMKRHRGGVRSGGRRQFTGRGLAVDAGATVIGRTSEKQRPD
jgi:hypothetical protein